jgi:3-oxoacyl-[acyl-carrier protein] reductase
MSGTFGVIGGENFAHLSAAKAGLIGFTRALAREVGKKGINVNAIAPAIIRTDLYNFMPEEVRDSIVSAYPLGRVGEVADIVSTALFLATSDGDYFTGQTLCPAGGDVMV